MDKEIKNQLQSIKLQREDILKYAKAMTNIPVDAIANRTLKNKMLQKYSREQIQQWINAPQKNEAKLREVVDYLCTISPQFCRLIEYIPNMAIITPFIKQKSSAYPSSKKSEGRDDKRVKDYEKMCEYYDMLKVKKYSKQILKEVFKYGVYYGLEIEGSYSVYIKRLQPDYCQIISEGEAGYGIAFNMKYFDSNAYLLENGYPKVFTTLYNAYKSGEKPLQGMNLGAEWQPIPNDITFVVKYDTNTTYSIPPYLNIFSALYDLNDYQELNKAKADAENYTLIGLKIPTLNGADKEDAYAISSDMVDATCESLDANLPPYMGYFVSGCEAQAIKGSSSGDTKIDNVSNAIKNVWNSSGFAETMFGVDNTNSGTLSYSIKTDEQQLFDIYDQLQEHWDYKLKLRFKNKFKFELLRTTWFNIFDLMDKYIQSAQISVPVAQILPLLLGFEVSDINDMANMHEQVLDIFNTWKALSSTFTQSGKDVTNEGGRPKTDDGKLGDAGEQTRSNESNSKR